MNRMSEIRLNEIYPPLAEAVRYMHEQLQREHGIEIRVTSGLRSWAEQKQLYEKRPRVTHARPGYSMHNFGLAVDLAPGILGVEPWQPDWNDKSESWQIMLQLGTELELECGGNWKRFVDLPHFQIGNFPVSPTHAMRTDYGKGGLKLVWANVRDGKYVIKPEVQI